MNTEPGFAPLPSGASLGASASDLTSATSAAGPVRPTAAFMRAHPAHWIALGFGAGLSPWAPGTVGTLWAWVSFLVLDRWLSDLQWGLLLGAGTLVGWWACTLTARHLRTADPSCVVWDEVLAFWAVLWLVMPTSFGGQLLAFALFRVLDAAKPGPVGWADKRFKRRRLLGGGLAGVAGAEGAVAPIGWAQGFGILFDDAVAALCTLLPIAVWRFGG